jgi:hypothetical protein
MNPANRLKSLIVVGAVACVAPLAGVTIADASGHSSGRRHPAHHRQTIPQHNGGDHDSDNNGGPSDGDGNV